jgi:hypothetical protein
MSKKIIVPTKDKWFYSKSRAPFAFKKVKGFEGWFYTGPTLHFGHPNDSKKGKKKGA